MAQLDIPNGYAAHSRFSPHLADDGGDQGSPSLLEYLQTRCPALAKAPIDAIRGGLDLVASIHAELIAQDAVVHVTSSTVKRATEFDREPVEARCCILSDEDIRNFPPLAVHEGHNFDRQSEQQRKLDCSQGNGFSGASAAAAAFSASDLEHLREQTWPWLIAALRILQKRMDAIPVDEEDEVTCQLESALELTSELMANLSGRAAASSFERAWKFGGAVGTLRIQETSFMQSDLGCKAWGAGIVLAFLLNHNLIDVPRGARILELGSGGTGMGGLAATRVVGPAAQVTMTDYHDGVLTQLQHNLDRNLAPEALESGRVRAAKLDWAWFVPDSAESDTTANGDASSAAPFVASADVVLAADVIYEARAVGQVRAALAACARNAPDRSAIIHVVLPMRPRYASDVALFEREVGAGLPHQRVLAYDGGLYRLYSTRPPNFE